MGGYLRFPWFHERFWPQEVGCLFWHHGNSHQGRTRCFIGWRGLRKWWGFICQWVKCMKGTWVPNYVGGGLEYVLSIWGKIPILTNILQVGWNHQLTRRYVEGYTHDIRSPILTLIYNLQYCAVFTCRFFNMPLCTFTVSLSLSVFTRIFGTACSLDMFGNDTRTLYRKVLECFVCCRIEIVKFGLAPAKLVEMTWIWQEQNVHKLLFLIDMDVFCFIRVAASTSCACYVLKQNWSC